MAHVGQLAAALFHDLGGVVEAEHAQRLDGEAHDLATNLAFVVAFLREAYVGGADFLDQPGGDFLGGGHGIQRG